MGIGTAVGVGLGAGFMALEGRGAVLLMPSFTVVGGLVGAAGGYHMCP